MMFEDSQSETPESNVPDDAPEDASKDASGATEEGAEEELPPYRIEAARSSRSRCRTCKRKIDKDKLRLGVLLEGPYGTGYLWHHLTCAAKRRPDDVEGAYELSAWDEGLEVPALDELRQLKQKAEEERAKRKEAPYVDVAPTARAKCKHCGEPIEKGSFRFALLREVVFGRQARGTPINVHPRCVAAELLAEDCITEVEGFHDAVRTNSRDMEASTIEEALTQLGDLG